MSEIYRDRSEGSAARREELLRRRRAELITLPHTVRRVVVARSSRITACAVAALGGIGLLALASSPSAMRAVGGVLPGTDPAVLATLLVATWTIAALAWGWSRARGEHRFVVEMSRYVMPSDDVDHDVERLDHERPDRVARLLAHELEVWSAAWPLLAAALVLPATALWIALAIVHRGWAVSSFEDGLVRNVGPIAAVAAIGAAGAVASLRRALRRPEVVLLASGAGLIALAAAGAAYVKGAWIAWPLAGLAGTALALAVTAWVLKRERARLAIDDPAAGSELFTLRGALRAVKAGLTYARAALLRVRPRYWAAAAAVAMISIGIGLAVRPSAQDDRLLLPVGTAARFEPAIAEPLPEAWGPRPVLAATPSPPSREAAGYSVEREGDHFLVQLTLPAHGEADVKLPELPSLPEGWQATLELSLVTGGPIGLLRDRPAKDPEDDVMLLDASRGGSGARTVVVYACDGVQPVRLKLRGQGRTTEVQLRVRPTLQLARCGG